MQIGDQIRTLRTANNMTQKELAQKVGLTPKMISFYENAERTPPIDIVTKLVSIFNTTSDYLLGLSPIPSFTQEPIHGEQLSEDESKLLNTYRSLGADEKQIVLGKALDLKLSSSVEARKKKDIG